MVSIPSQTGRSSDNREDKQEKTAESQYLLKQVGPQTFNDDLGYCLLASQYLLKQVGPQTISSDSLRLPMTVSIPSQTGRSSDQSFAGADLGGESQYLLKQVGPQTQMNWQRVCNNGLNTFSNR